MDQDFDIFMVKVTANGSLSELEVDVIKNCRAHLRAQWCMLQEEHALEELRLAARVVPRNIQLKHEAADEIKELPPEEEGGRFGDGLL